MDQNDVQLLSVYLEDPGSQRKFKLMLTASDIERLQTDAEFFALNLKIARSVQLANETCDEADTAEETNPPTDIEPHEFSAIDSVQDGNDAFKWSHVAILLLLEEFRIREDQFKTGKISQKKLWHDISERLRKHGHVVTGPQCMSKYAGMKRTYKSIKDHNGRSRASARKWPYLSIMDELLKNKPFMNPVATTSSTGSTRSRSSSVCSRTSTSETSRYSDDDSGDCPVIKKKKQTPAMQTVMDLITDHRATAEKNKERRFQIFMEEKARRSKEQYEQKERACNLLEKLLEACKKKM